MHLVLLMRLTQMHQEKSRNKFHSLGPIRTALMYRRLAMLVSLLHSMRLIINGFSVFAGANSVDHQSHT